MGEEFKFQLISWTKVYTRISKGGLRVWILLVFNQALMGKCLLRYVSQERGLMEGDCGF